VISFLNGSNKKPQRLSKFLRYPGLQKLLTTIALLIQNCKAERFGGIRGGVVLKQGKAWQFMDTTSGCIWKLSGFFQLRSCTRKFHFSERFVLRSCRWNFQESSGPQTCEFGGELRIRPSSRQRFFPKETLPLWNKSDSVVFRKNF